MLSAGSAGSGDDSYFFALTFTHLEVVEALGQGATGASDGDRAAVDLNLDCNTLKEYSHHRKQTNEECV